MGNIIRLNARSEELERLAEKLKSLEIEFEFRNIDGEIKLAFVVKDFFKKPFFEFALSESQLEDFLHDLKGIKKEDEGN